MNRLIVLNRERMPGESGLFNERKRAARTKRRKQRTTTLQTNIKYFTNLLLIKFCTMRKILFAALAATTLLASCSKENANTPVTEGQKATLTVSIADSETRAAVAALPDNTMVISNYFVVVTDGANIIAKKYSSSNAALTLDGTDGVTTAASKVYVVANVGDGNTFFTAAELASEATFKNAVKTALDNGVIASGEGVVTMVAADPTVLKASVPLKFVKARITLSLTLQDETGTAYSPTASDELVLTHVAVLNAFGKSKLFGTSLYDAGNTPLYNGIAVAATTPFTPTAGEATLVDNITAGEYTKKYVYHVCENDDVATDPTILTVVGKWNGEFRYYPVHFTLSDALKTFASADQKIQRGKSYNINMTLKGKWSTGGGGGTGGNGGGTGDGEGDLPGGGGTTDPKEELLPASIAVTVTVNNWEPVAINKEF